MGVGQIPDALRKLRIFLLPVFVGTTAGGAAQSIGVIVPGTAPDDVWIHGSSDGNGIHSGFIFELGVEIGDVLIENPFGDVAVDIVQAPGIGKFLADFFVAAVAVVEVPGVLAEFGFVVAKGIGSVRAGAAGIFPFGLGRQAVVVAGFGAEPAAIHAGGVVGHADGREAFLAHAERHVGVGLRGASEGVGVLIVFGGLDVENFAAVDVEREHEDFEFVPGDFAFAKPEGIELNFVLGAFVRLAAGLGVGATHREFAAGDGKYVEGGIGVVDGFGVGFHLAGGTGRASGTDWVGCGILRAEVGRGDDPTSGDKQAEQVLEVPRMVGYGEHGSWRELRGAAGLEAR